MYRLYIILLSITLFCSVCTKAQTANHPVVPDTMVLDQRWSYNNYTHMVLPTIEWLLANPIDSNKHLRSRHDNFLMYWLQKNEDVVVFMPEYLVKFQNISRELYFIYTAGWIKHAILTGDTSRTRNAMAAVNTVLNYYEEGKGVPQSDYLDKILQIRKNGNLTLLFDSTAKQNNTFLYLLTSTEKHNFKPNENYFNFRYTGINFSGEKSLQYRYKLQGYYNDWIYTNEESIVYPKLPSGRYIFTLQASAYPGFINAKEISYSFYIATPFYKQWWFVLLCAILIAATIYWYMKRREKRLNRIAALQHEKVTFEYEYLKSQVNPHFLFNSLNTLTSLIDERPKAAIEYTDHLSDLYRNMLAHPDRTLVTIAEEMEILSNYIHIQKTRFGEALIINDNIPEGIKNTKRVVYLALQLLVENAIKHNIVSATKPLTIDIFVKDDQLIISNPIQKKVSRQKGSGMGLANVEKRYGLVSQRPISYREEDNKFIVKLPLL